MIGFGILSELDSLDLASALSGRLRDTVHPVHYRSLSRQDDRVGQIRFVDERHVLEHGPPSLRFVGPGLIQLPNRDQRNPLPG